MTLQELEARLDCLGIPVAYRAFAKAVDPPFICWFGTGSRNFFADGKVYTGFEKISVELYADRKSPQLEQAVEAALPGGWSKNEDWIEEERLIRSTYTFDL